MITFISWFESFFQSIPLPLLQVWGSFGFIAGLILMVLAYGGFTLRNGDEWSFGREKHSWDTRSVLSIGLSFVLILLSGYLGSFLVLVPGAQTFESLKDLAVFVCILLFGYPALLAVPFAYGLADLYEGVPPEFLRDWFLGYFINPACFWLAYQFIGKNPDFRLKKVWKNYLVFVLLFMFIEPQLWGYICSGRFTPKISYLTITPALFFTTSITWILAPFAMILALPLAKKLKLFWAEIPGYVKEKAWGAKDWSWQSGLIHTPPSDTQEVGLPLRLFILAPFTVIVVALIGSTAHFTLSNSEWASNKLAQNLHHVVSENIKLKLDNHFLQSPDDLGPLDFNHILKKLPYFEKGRAYVIERQGKLVASSENADPKVRTEAIDRLLKHSKLKFDSQKPFRFQFDQVISKPLSHQTWIVNASPYKDNWIVLTVIPKDYYLEGVQKGQSNSAMIFAVALLLGLITTVVLGSIVIQPIQKICRTTEAFSKGELSQRVPESKLKEINTLSMAINKMAEQLQSNIANLQMSENRLQLATRAAHLGIWEWDIENNDLIWDDQMYELYGMNTKETRNEYLSWSDQLVEEDKKMALEEIQAALRGDKEFDTEFRIRKPDGKITRLKAHSLTIRNAQGKAIKMVGVNYDITERKKAEEELLNYRNHLEELVVAKTTELKNLSEKQARSEVYEKFAQIFLSMRDYANNPLQVQTLAIAMLRIKCPEQGDLIDQLERSVLALSNMNKILSRMEPRISEANLRVLSESEILEYLDLT